MKPTWKQLIRAVITVGLLIAFAWMFIQMGYAVIYHDDVGLADVVTSYGTFLAIVGVLLGGIIKDLFSDGN